MTNLCPFRPFSGVRNEKKLFRDELEEILVTSGLDLENEAVKAQLAAVTQADGTVVVNLAHRDSILSKVCAHFLCDFPSFSRDFWIHYMVYVVMLCGNLGSCGVALWKRREVSFAMRLMGSLRQVLAATLRSASKLGWIWMLICIIHELCLLSDVLPAFIMM